MTFTMRGAVMTRRVETIIDGRDQARRARDLAAEVEALRAEVRRLRDVVVQQRAEIDLLLDRSPKMAVFGARR